VAELPHGEGSIRKGRVLRTAWTPRAPPWSNVSVAARRSERGAAAGSENLRHLAREARVARALRDVAGALGAALELDELLELVLGKLTELLESDRAILFLLDERSRELVTRVASLEADASLRLPLGDGLLGFVARTGRTVRVEDFV
jgi:transcriptional regulator with GAF, ATPase, and Fis domain